MTDWVNLDRRPSLKPRTEVVGGVETKVFSPPSELPIAYRSRYDKAAGSAIVDFKYTLEDEGFLRLHTKKGAILTIGKESERLYSVQLPIDDGVSEDDWGELRGQVVSNIISAIEDELRREPRRHGKRMPIRTENARAAEEALRRESQHLFLSPVFG